MNAKGQKRWNCPLLTVEHGFTLSVEAFIAGFWLLTLNEKWDIGFPTLASIGFINACLRPLTADRIKQNGKHCDLFFLRVFGLDRIKNVLFTSFPFYGGLMQSYLFLC